MKTREHCSEIGIHKECESSFGVTGRESDIETEADECIFQRRQAFLPPAKTRVQGKMDTSMPSTLVNMCHHRQTSQS